MINLGQGLGINFLNKPRRYVKEVGLEAFSRSFSSYALFLLIFIIVTNKKNYYLIGWNTFDNHILLL